MREQLCSELVGLADLRMKLEGHPEAPGERLERVNVEANAWRRMLGLAEVRRRGWQLKDRNVRTATSQSSRRLWPARR
jgi:hypothetical protein